MVDNKIQENTFPMKYLVLDFTNCSGWNHGDKLRGY